MTETTTPGKKLKDLRVSDLKVELDKRGLPTSGIKAFLVDRLQKQLEDDGLDPEVFDFSLVGGDPKEMETEDGTTDEMVEKELENGESIGNIEEAQLDNKVNSSGSKGDEEKQTPNSNATRVAEREINNVDDSRNCMDSSIENTKSDGKMAGCNQDRSSDQKLPGETNTTEDDSINLMIGDDEENLMYDDEQENKNGTCSSPPRPENAPVVNPFTSRDTISMGASRTNNAPSDNSSMLVHIDETESVATQGSNEGINTKDEGQQNGENSEKPNESDKGDGNSSVSSTVEDKIGESKNEEKQSSSGLNLWVSGLASTTRATDLKTAFSKHGKVVGAKVVTNARTPGAKCYGYVSMGCTEDADKCIKELHKTELHGRVILVEKARADSSGPPRQIPKDEKSKKEENSSTNKSEDQDKESSSNRDESGTSIKKEVSDSKSIEGSSESSKKEEEKKKDAPRSSSRGRSNNSESRTDRERREQRRREEERDRERRDREHRRPRSPPRRREHATQDLRGRIMSRDRSPPRRNYDNDARGQILGGSNRDRRDHPNRGANVSPPRRRSPPRERRRTPNSSRELSPRRQDRPDPGRPGILTFSQIREQQQREKDRENERRRRARERQVQIIEEERRRKEEDQSRVEQERLHREREELRREREKLEREKQELMKFERERQRLERERLQREKEDLERLRRQQQQTRLEETRRAPKRPPAVDDRDPYYDDRKRR
jgi:RNA recognition motif-containing protein